MNGEQLRQCLDALDDESWAQLLAGKALVLEDDARLEVGEKEDPNCCILPQEGDLAEVKASLAEQAEEIVNHYYLSHPLTVKGFNDQVMALVAEHGAEAFAFKDYDKAERTLFVEHGTVHAYDRTDPRHQYGASCEVENSFLSSVPDQVSHWINSGMAYDAYLSMNVCRYNCGDFV